MLMQVLEEFASILDFVKVTIMGYPHDVDSGNVSKDC